MIRREYLLGKLFIPGGFNMITEGPVCRPEDKTRVLAQLDQARSYGHVQWSDKTLGLLPTEQQADEIISYFRALPDEQLLFAGDSPVDARHGTWTLDKVARLWINREADKRIADELADRLSTSPRRITAIKSRWSVTPSIINQQEDTIRYGTR